MPDVAAAAVFPPFAGPGFGGHFHGLVFKAVGRVAGHHPEAPRLLAGVGVIGGDVAARRAPFRAAVANHDLAAEHFRGAGDEQGFARVDRHRAPQLLAVAGIDRDQPAVDRGAVDFAFPVGQPAAGIPHHAQTVAGVFDDLGVIRPQHLATAGIDRVDEVVTAFEIHHPVDDQGRAEQGSIVRQIEVPGEAELVDVGIVDLLERAEALLTIGAPESRPVAPVGFVSERSVVDFGGGGSGAGQQQAGQGRNKCTRHSRVPGMVIVQ